MEAPALLGGNPVRTQPYPSWPVWDQKEIDAVTAVIRSGQWGGYPYPGPCSSALIDKFLSIQGGKHAVLVVNGTITMEVALRAANIGWGDEVIVPAYTFQATASSPMAAGAIPVIVDIDPVTYCIDPAAVKKAITARTKAVIPVHIGSNMADMDAIMSLAEEHHLIVIEDAAHAHGAKWRGLGAGTIGDFGSFSLQSSKTLSSGEGGILICRSAEHAALAASIVDCGRTHALGGGPEDDQGYASQGSNFRMSELHAALALCGLERFPAQFQQREEQGAFLDEALSEIEGIRVIQRDHRLTARSHFLYVFALQVERFGIPRDLFCAALNAEGIPCSGGYPAMNAYSLFQPQRTKLAVPAAFPSYFDLENMSMPVAETACRDEVVWLGESILRSDHQGINDVITAIQKITDNRDALVSAAKAQGVI